MNATTSVTPKTTGEAFDLLKITAEQLDAKQYGMAIHNLTVVSKYINSIPGLKTQIQWKLVRRHAALLKRYAA